MRQMGLVGERGFRAGDSRPGMSLVNNSLAYLNDNGKTWPQIADIIMADPSQYFTEPK